MSKIEWTQQTWNPIVGCSIVSPGCTNCYAMSMAARLEAMASKNRSGPHDSDTVGWWAENTSPLDHYLGTTKPSKAGPVWTGKVALAPDRILTEPLRRRKPTTYFVNSMGDLFHEDCPDEWIDKVFAVMALTPQHTFQILTKRSARMRAYLTSTDVQHRLEQEMLNFIDQMPKPWAYEANGFTRKIVCRDPVVEWPLGHIWIGVSAERQQEADARIPDLLATPAAVRFVSAEPLLGPIDFTMVASDGVTGLHTLERGPVGLDWVIVGGESGPHARPMHPDWARSIRDQCAAAGVPFFFKQWGAWVPDDEGAPIDWRSRPSGWVCLGTDGLRKDGYSGGREQFMRLEGKARAGRLLDGVLHDAYPSRRQQTEAA